MFGTERELAESGTVSWMRRELGARLGRLDGGLGDIPNAREHGGGWRGRGERRRGAG